MQTRFKQLPFVVRTQKDKISVQKLVSCQPLLWCRNGEKPHSTHLQHLADALLIATPAFNSHGCQTWIVPMSLRIPLTSVTL